MTTTVSARAAERMILNVEISERGHQQRRGRLRLAAIRPPHRQAFLDGLAVDLGNRYWVRRI
ncbi:MAG: hypothetical protein ACOC0M_00115 [Halomonas sp.]